MGKTLNHRTLVSFTALLILVVLGLPRTASADGKRKFDVSDSVEMSYFGTIRVSAPDDLDDDGVVSPDGRYFVKVTHRGVLPQGVTEGTLWLFDVASTLRSLRDPRLSVAQPTPLAQLSAAVNGGLGVNVLDAGNTITSPRWSSDSQSLIFVGRNGHANQQLFEVDLASHTLRPLTPPNQNVLAYSQSGDRIVYLAGADADLQAAQAWTSAGTGIPDISVGTDTPLMPLLYPHFKGNAYGEPLEVELWQVHDGQAKPVIDSNIGTAVKLVTRYRSLLISLSPDGTRAVTIAESSGVDAHSAKSGNDANASALQYRMIDLRSGVATDIPGVHVANSISGLHRAAWAPDGRQIAVGEAQVPDDARGHMSFCGVVLVSTRRADARCIAPLDGKEGALMALDWSADGEHIEARYRADESHESYLVLQWTGSRWRSNPRAARTAGPSIRLSVREALNDPPVLVATDSHTGKSRAIFDPNPQLAEIDFGSVQVYRWKDSRGREDIGGLALPPDFVHGRRYPLVIQTHGFNPQHFFRVGYADTSNAGRALTSRDIVVLQVREPHPLGKPSWRDGVELGLGVYLPAIDQLAADGLVDPTKVGISGYSYSGWLVANAIVHAPQRFAAAEIANSDPVTLTGYYEYVGTPLAAEEAEASVGARPYGDGLKTWIERVPSFSTDKIIAPVLFQPADPWHLISIWDMYAALVDQRKPVELQYIRGGEHNIRKPLEVLAHQEMIVDWFDFWLNGHENDSPNKVEQYRRWRKLRDSRTAVQTEAHPSQTQGIHPPP
jgi:dipeptidyl aminopeptidase/acylaminoacyl peptidase